MSKFKIGDRVKIIKRLPDNSTGVDYNTTGNVGKIGYIVDITPFGKYDVWKTVKENDGYYGLFISEEIRLVKEEEEEEPLNFIVSWEEKGCGDPQERFATLAEANKKARELGENEDMLNIDIVEIKNRWIVESKVAVKIIKRLTNNFTGVDDNTNGYVVKMRYIVDLTAVGKYDVFKSIKENCS